MNNKFIIVLAALLLSFSLLSCSGGSSSYPKIVYVDNANDSGIEDGSFEHPFSTIQKAIDLAHKDNTLIYIRKGNGPYFVEEGILVDIADTKNLILWGSGYNKGFPGIADTAGYPILQSSTLGRERPLYIRDSENITIIGLDLRGGQQNVIYAAGAKSLTIKHCIISGAEIPDGEIWTRTSGILIYAFGSGDISSDITITDNIFFDNDTGGINLSVFGNPTYGYESTIENVLIARNTFYQTQDAEYRMFLPIICEIWCGLMQNVVIEENDMNNFGDRSDWSPAGVFFLQRLTENPLSKNIAIRNNRIANSASDSDGIWVEVRSGKVEDLTITGNHISNTGKGITLMAPGAGPEPGAGGGRIEGAVVAGNVITNSQHSRLAGLLLVALEDGFLSAKVSRNVVQDGLGYGVWLDRDVDATLIADLGGGPLGAIGFNAFVNNQLGELGIEDDNVGPQSAKYNWWGQANDPGSLIQGDIDYTPWLIVNPNY